MVHAAQTALMPAASGAGLEMGWAPLRRIHEGYATSKMVMLKTKKMISCHQHNIDADIITKTKKMIPCDQHNNDAYHDDANDDDADDTMYDES